VAKEKELNLAIAITARPENEHANDETQSAVDKGKDHAPGMVTDDWVKPPVDP